MDFALIVVCLTGVSAGRVTGGLHIKRAADLSVAHVQAGSKEPCSMMGGYVSGNVSHTCCSNVQAITQRTLSTYGLGPKKCLPAWKCDKDGVHPTPIFEQQALSQFCFEPGCKDVVRSAMMGDWKTVVGAPAVDMLCNQKNGPSIADLEGVTSAFRMGKVHREDEKKEEKKKDEKKDEKKEEGMKCFPGEAIVQTRVGGAVRLNNVQPGEHVLVEDDGALRFAPILSFLHATHENGGEYLELVHEHGQVRMTANHIIFVAGPHGRIDKPAGMVMVGDQIFAVMKGTTVTSTVLQINRKSMAMGMFAPLTHTGTIVVDGVVASNYALPDLSTKLPHSVAHFVLLPVRIYHALGLNHVMEGLRKSAFARYLATGSHLLHSAASEYHPYIEVIHKRLGIEQLLRFV